MPIQRCLFRLSCLLPFLLSMVSTHGLAATTIDGMRSSDTVQGLHEIREKAREFVALENAKAQGTWEAGEPNLKVLVPRCAVPLRARWDAVRWSSVGRGGELQPHSRRVIAVVCAQAVKASPKWDVHVPVTLRR